MSDIVEFRHLEYLVAIAERKNFSKAAEHVLRSQPAVSHQIKMVEADIGYDASTGNVFASNADGTFTVIHQDNPDQYSVTQNLATPVGSRNMGLDASNHRIFVVSAEFGAVPSGVGRRPVLPGTFTLLVIEQTHK